MRTELTEKGLDAGAETIRTRRILVRRELVAAAAEAAESSYRSFAADLPNERRQADATD